MPHDAHPMGVLVSAMSALSVFHPDANPALRGQDLYKSKQVRDKQIVRILGKAPTIAAMAYLRMAGRPPVLPSSNLSYSENFLYMLDSLGDRSYKPNPQLARVLDILFILHAEHEMNCSTAAARHLASSGVDVYTALAGAVGALYGPLHGGANEAVLKMLGEIGTVDNIPEFIEGVKNRKRKMSGFGHRVYKNYDPRAKVIRKLAEEVFSIVGRDPLIEVAVALEKAALSDEYFIKRKLYPNVDFYSGLIYRAMGFPTEFFPVLFAIPRMAGYLSHWRESLDDPDTKIMRPAQTLQFSNSNNVFINGLTSLNSQMFHFVIYNCNNVKVQGAKILASGNSPNTDGIHIASSSGVTIMNSRISTGDDCVSIGSGTTNLWIENVACGPGHGISIGSLGQTLHEAGVQNVTVKTVTFTGTQNGVRIKTWAKPSNGFVRGVLFQHATMINVQNPIIIEQNYCPDNKNCPNQVSGVKISDVTYQDIHGSSATQVAVKFYCSKKYPCSKITLEDINLTYKNKPAQSTCANAGGSASGLVKPSSCL